MMLRFFLCNKTIPEVIDQKDDYRQSCNQASTITSIEKIHCP